MVGVVSVMGLFHCMVAAPLALVQGVLDTAYWVVQGVLVGLVDPEHQEVQWEVQLVVQLEGQ